MGRKRENYIGDNVKDLKPDERLREGFWTKLCKEKVNSWEISDKELDEICRDTKSSKKQIKELMEYWHSKTPDTFKKYLKVKSCKFRKHCLCSSGTSEAVMIISEKCPHFIDWEQHSFKNLEEAKYYKKNREQRVICSLPKSVEFILNE